MGYLLKEALKTLCGVNQWSYAVFWKTGCQNPKLLIWEECYYEPASCYGRLAVAGNVVTEGNKVHLLVNKMMVDNHVNVVGEGLVGRVAFTGNYQWILSENYYRETHPPEVLKEVCLQFSAGMQTVAVVPILPHGVAQFGSYFPIAEDIGFVNGVMSLIAELGCVPGVLRSVNQEANELSYKVGIPLFSGYSSSQDTTMLESNMMGASSFFADSLSYVGCSAQTSAFDSHMPFRLVGEVHDGVQSGTAASQASNSSSFLTKPYDYHEGAKVSEANKFDFPFPSQFMSGVAKAEVLPSNSVAQMNRYSPLKINRSIEDLSFCSSYALSHASMRCTERKIVSENASEGHFINPMPPGIQVSKAKTYSGLRSSCKEDDSKAASETVTSVHTTSSGLKNMSLSKKETSFSDFGHNLSTNPLLAYCSGANDLHTNEKFEQGELGHCKEEMKQMNVLADEIPLMQNTGKLKVAEAHFVGDSQSGDDLFDILGADFKDKCWKSYLNVQPTAMVNCGTIEFPSNSNLAASQMYSSNQGKSDSGIFSFSSSGHLLDAVVSKVQPFTKDDDNSCGTSLNDTSSSSVPTALLPYGKIGVSDDVKGDLLGMPKCTAKASMICSSSVITMPLKEDSGMYGQGGSTYDPWIERGHNIRQSNSAPTGYSTKPHEPSKTNRKRLKQGENPRPRPKDRQMIQDRVKELREIVPNGAKCSIDALLERTIKHMLFLQSVTKHADKLKQNAESKITSKDGGLLLKDDFGGATWAYEVGSQSMVCPIIVEDLNQPHQMLVEMLCEERGLFLEIADVIRGLGLTILKGLMETRNDKIWARFAVEASRNVTRMEIFLSLVRLLEQNAKSGVPKSSSTDMKIQEGHQAASIPTSGGSPDDFVC